MKFTLFFEKLFMNNKFFHTTKPRLNFVCVFNISLRKRQQEDKFFHISRRTLKNKIKVNSKKDFFFSE